MDSKRSLSNYRYWYQRLIRLYPKKHQDLFGESMMQTFDDLCTEKEQDDNSETLHFLIWMFADTGIAFLKEYLYVTTKAMKNKPIALIGLILLLPFSTLTAIGIGWQLLHYFGYADLPHLAWLIPNLTLGYALIVIFPVTAFLLSVVVLMI